MSTNGNRNRGWAAVIGAAALWGLYVLMILGTTGVIPSLKTLEDKHWLFHIFETPIMAVLTVGVLELYRAQRHVFGKLGKIGGYLALFGYGYGVVGSVIIVAAELLAGLDTANGFLDFLAHVPGILPQMIGSLAFGIATLRAGILPRAAAGLLAIGGVASPGSLPGVPDPAAAPPDGSLRDQAAAGVAPQRRPA